MSHLKFVLLIIPLCALAYGHPDIESPEQLLWENRIVMIWADGQVGSRQMLDAAGAEIEDRDVVWFVIDGLNVTSNYRGEIADHFVTVANQKYAGLSKKVVLLGKDGGVKYTSDELRLDVLFQEIDSMPMRKNEMKFRGSKGSF
ncbi:DUF4174 domain-containing protein [Marinicella sediminis]|uniref:DUF4174 domain-containing protein n=1 Tax=Marinicella sediminis TaxID=1792834 RepID=A0ABV7JA25_9GAMM|nr:DUF4174 domain-containing protein [Marinicella sediminis]